MPPRPHKSGNHPTGARLACAGAPAPRARPRTVTALVTGRARRRPGGPRAAAGPRTLGPAPSNGKKIAAAALSGLMAMGTLPVAALAETGVETQATQSTQSLLANGKVTFHYGDKDYTLDGTTTDLKASDYVEGQLAQVTSVESDGTTYTYSTDSINYNANQDNYRLLDASGKETSWISSVRVTKANDKVTVTFRYLNTDGGNVLSRTATAGTAAVEGETVAAKDGWDFTYDGEAHTLQVVDKDGKAVSGVTITKRVDKNGTYTNQYKDQARSAGTYTFTLSDGKEVTVTVKPLNLNSATISAEATTGGTLTADKLYINGNKASGAVQGAITLTRADGTTNGTGRQSWKVSARSGQSNVTGTDAPVDVDVVSQIATFEYVNGGSAYSNGTLDTTKDANHPVVFSTDNVRAYKSSQKGDANEIPSSALSFSYAKKDGSEATLSDVQSKAGDYVVTVKVDPTKVSPAYSVGGIFVINVHVGYDQSKVGTVTVKYDGNVDARSATYTGSAIEPEVTVHDASGNALAEGTDYTVTYKDASGNVVDSMVDAGKYTITVKAEGRNIGTANSATDTYETTFTVEPATVYAQLSSDGQAAGGYYAYTGSAITPKFDFFVEDADGAYVKDGDEYVAYADLSAKEQALIPQSATRYAKVDLDSSEYSVAYKSGSKSVSEVKDVAPYSFVLKDAKDGSNYDVEELDGGITVSQQRTFADVAQGSWYFDSVEKAEDQGWIHGYGDGTFFGPEDSISRADVAVVLYNMNQGKKSGRQVKGTDDYKYSTETGYDTGFSDVDGTKYYAQAIAWAKAAGVVNGYGDGTFRPDQPVTREEFAAMLANYAQRAGDYEAGSDSDLARFADASAVSDWARGSVAWAVHAGVISGKDGRVIDPQANVTRAETAAMVVSYAA